MLISLIVSSLGRTETFPKLFESLTDQTVQDFELIIVDQNDDSRLQNIVEDFDPPFPVKYVPRPGERGASRGRNNGIKHAEGDILAFPDDDCWYPADFLQKAVELLEHTSADLISGRAAEEGTLRSINGRFETTAQPIDRDNVWTTQIEWVMFFRRAVIEAINGYDEDIGVGASTPWQSCECQDIVLRALQAGFNAYYSPDLYGHHAELEVYQPDHAMRKKAASYARGHGYVVRLHGYGIGTAAYWVSRPLANAGLNLARFRISRARYLLEVAIGRMQGYFARGQRDGRPGAGSVMDEI